MPLLEISQLKKSFTAPDGGRHTVVDIEEFTLPEKAQVALAGESGSGKTTFLNLVAGILKPDSGTIRLAGEEMSALSEAQRDRLRARRIGYIFQTFNLLQGHTVLENVLLGMAFGAGEDRARAEALLKRVGLEQRLHHKPRQLSVGQQQRVAVARALANRPQLVLADENGAALLLVSHDREVLGQFESVQDLAKLNRAAVLTV
jgi:ABC-type lipoprotein export system ATPase subunit